MIPSCVLLSPLTKADIQAACVQAEAALQAGMAQADAARFAGKLTLLAGGFALVAAVIGALTVRYQVNKARDAAAEQRQQELKREVFIPAVSTLAEGLFVIPKLANVTMPLEQVFSAFNAKGADLFAFHVGANERTAAKFFEALTALQKYHTSLLLDAGEIRAKGLPYTQEELFAWGEQCTKDLDTLIKPMILATAAMRGELGLQTDEAEYERLMRAALQRAIDLNNALIAEAHARGRRSSGHP